MAQKAAQKQEKVTTYISPHHSLVGVVKLHPTCTTCTPVACSEVNHVPESRIHHMLVSSFSRAHTQMQARSVAPARVQTSMRAMHQYNSLKNVLEYHRLRMRFSERSCLSRRWALVLRTAFE